MKKISVLGDSISTYDGYNPDGYAVYYNRFKQVVNDLEDVSDTWWFQVMRYLDGELCVNNSYSGSRVTGKNFPCASCDRRIAELKNSDNIPDIILVYIGFNDFGFQCSVSGADDNDLNFDYAYENMVKKLKTAYPESLIICCTLMGTYMKEYPHRVFPYGTPDNIDDYNNVIRKVCQKHHILLVDMAKKGVLYQTIDGSHATADGHKTMAEVWIECFEELPLR